METQSYIHEIETPRLKQNSNSKKNIIVKKNLLVNNESHLLSTSKEIYGDKKNPQMTSSESSIPSLPKLTQRKASIEKNNLMGTETNKSIVTPSRII